MNPQLKNSMKKYLPEWAVDVYRRSATAWESALDYRDHVVASRRAGRRPSRSALKDEREFLQSRLTVLSHGLEKGGTFPEPRRPFGTKRIYDTQQVMAQADRLGLDISVADALEAIEAVEQFNSQGVISDTVSPWSTWSGEALDNEQIEGFVSSRHSVRHFDPSIPVDEETVMRAVRLAGRTPSVCNRRAYRAHYYTDPDQVRSILELQNGNRGFRESVPGVIVVSVRRSAFRGPGERNQRWIDGGLFAMSLVWLLHAHGLGTCFLNWSEVHKKTKALRKVGNIPTTEDVVVLIAVGHPPKKHRVAVSPERPLGDIYRKH